MKFLFGVILLLLVANEVKAEPLVYLYTYHQKPPFIVDKDKRQGLYYDLAEALNKISTKYKYYTVYVPRKRLNLMLTKNNFDGVVVGVLPTWFGDKTKQKYLWLPGFFPDRDNFVSLTATPFEYQIPITLEGKTVGSVAGYYYRGINEAVDAGKLNQVNTVGELEVLQLIKKQRVDLGLVSESVFKYLWAQGDIEDIFHFSNIPHDQFIRQAFTTKNNQAVYQELTMLIKQLENSNQLESIFSRYQ